MQGEQVFIAADNGTGVGDKRQSQEFIIPRVATGRSRIDTVHHEHPAISPDLFGRRAARRSVQIPIKLRPLQDLFHFSQRLGTGADLAA